MRNIIKKYPKRIIITALVILLIAVVGTVNNYRTYRNDEPYIYLNSGTVEYMEEIYGEITASTARGRSKLYYKKIDLEKRVEESGLQNTLTMEIDAQTYTPDDTVKVTIENHYLSNVEFYSQSYTLQVLLENRWFTVHGAISGEVDGELVQLGKGEKYELEIPLSSVRELSDEPITLRPGQYRLSKTMQMKTKTGDRVVGEACLICEFEVI